MDIWTDGACSGNPGPGGWAALLRFQGKEKEISGHVPNATNNQMELMAVIKSLQVLKRPMTVKVHTDSAYIVNAFTQGWVKKWQRNGWQSASGPVKNQELWKELINLKETHDVSFQKVKGHSGHPENERVDRLAVAARDNRI